MPKGVYVRTEKNRKNLSLALMGRKLSKEHKEHMKGRPLTSSCFVKGCKPWNTGLNATDPRVKAMIQKTSLIRRGKSFPNWGGSNPEATKAKISMHFRGKTTRPHTEEQKKLISIKLKGRPKTEHCKELLSLALKGRKHSEERIRAIVNGVTKSRKESREMTKPEIRIFDVLQSMYGKYNPFEYTGNRKFWIDIPNAKLKKFKNPDFIFKSDKKVIEVFGRYWHKNDNPELLISDYKSVGWKCLVIWDDETGAEVIDRIHLFTFPAEYWKEYYECNKVS